MKNAKMTIWTVVVVLLISRSQAMGWIQLNDGGIYNIDSQLYDDIGVDYQAPGMQTTVNVLDGGKISSPYKLQGFNDSRINIYGGYVYNLQAHSSSQIAMSGGEVSYKLHAQDSSHVTMLGGEVNWFPAYDSSQITMSGGFVNSFTPYDNSQITISGGSVTYLEVHGNSKTTFLADASTGFLYTYGSGEVTMSGGEIRNSLNAYDSGQINWSGGTIGSDLFLVTNAKLIINGFDFVIDGSPVGFGEIASILGNVCWDEPYRHLTGTLANGDVIDNRFKIGYDAQIVLISEPATPPVADADGPYSIYVGDTLTLDANGSTDDDYDIVSYMWDLDDNGTFETDAGSQAVFDVNYAYLYSLGLLVDHTYNIRLKVTDSEGQSDVNDSIFTIVPKPALQVAVDIKPGSCPNPMNVKSSGVLPIAILGTADVNVLDIVPTSIQLAGVYAIRNDYEDVAAQVIDTNDCNCTEAGPDGFLDLALKFKTQAIVGAIGDVNEGDVLTLVLEGVLFGERPIEGADCILVKGKHRVNNKADINKDGVVNLLDFSLMTENWLQGVE